MDRAKVILKMQQQEQQTSPPSTTMEQHLNNGRVVTDCTHENEYEKTILHKYENHGTDNSNTNYSSSSDYNNGTTITRKQEVQESAVQQDEQWKGDDERKGGNDVETKLETYSDDEFGIISEDDGVYNDKLAVAVPVDENGLDDGDNNNKYLPAAIEFDPDQKNADDIVRHRRRRIRCIIGIILIPTLLISIGIGIFVSIHNKNKNNNNNNKYVDPRTQLGIHQLVADTIPNPDSLNDFNSPYSKALHWIIHKDPLQLQPSTPRFLQRYLLSYVYYATSHNRDWSYCSPPSATTNNDTEITTVASTNRSSTTKTNNKMACRITYWYDVPSYTNNQKPWLSEEDEHIWAGIDCDGFGHVISINIGKDHRKRLTYI
jgi:hypothetical protein